MANKINTSLATPASGVQSTPVQSASAIDMSGGSKMGTAAQIKQILGGGGGYGLASMDKAAKTGLLNSLKSGSMPSNINMNSKLTGATAAYTMNQKAAGTATSPTQTGTTPPVQTPTLPTGTTSTTSTGTGTTTSTPATKTTSSPLSFTGAGGNSFTVGADSKVYNSNGTLAAGKTYDPTTGKVTSTAGKTFNVGLLNSLPDTVTGGATEDTTDKVMTDEEMNQWAKDKGFVSGDEFNQWKTDFINSQTTPTTPTTTTTDAGPDAYDSNLNSPVNWATDTIQGQIQNLIATDGSGNFQNPVIRQAADAAMAMFAERGLLNSSMAQQAALEAAISKAIEIAGPDADKYFENRRGNVDWANKFAQGTQQYDQTRALATLDQAYKTQNLDTERAFTLQQNYLNSVQNIDKMYQSQVLALQGSQLDPTSKQQALNDLAINRDNSLRLTTKSFESMPQWEDQWSQMLTVALPSYQAKQPSEQILAGTFTGSDDYDILNAIQWGALNEDAMSDDIFNGLVAEADRRNLRR